MLVPWRLLDCCFGFGYYCWCLAASSCHQTRYAIAARSAAAAPLCHRPSLFLFLLCLSEQGEPAAETQQTLHARWIPPRLTGAQGIALKRSLQHCWKKGRRDGPALLACCCSSCCTQARGAYCSVCPPPPPSPRARPSAAAPSRPTRAVLVANTAHLRPASSCCPRAWLRSTHHSLATHLSPPTSHSPSTHPRPSIIPPTHPRASPRPLARSFGPASRQKRYVHANVVSLLPHTPSPARPLRA